MGSAKRDAEEDKKIKKAIKDSRLRSKKGGECLDSEEEIDIAKENTVVNSEKSIEDDYEDDILVLKKKHYHDDPCDSESISDGDKVSH